MKVNDTKSVETNHLNCVWNRLVHLPSLKKTSTRMWNTVNIHMTTVVHESSSVSRPSSHQPHTHWTLCKQTLAGENRSLDHHHRSCKHRCAENRVMKQKQTKLNRKYSRTWTNRLHISTTGKPEKRFKKKKKRQKYFKIKEDSRDLIYQVQIWIQTNIAGGGRWAFRAVRTQNSLTWNFLNSSVL